MRGKRPGGRSTRQTQPGAPTARRLERGSVSNEHGAPRSSKGAPHQVRIIGGRWKRTPLTVLEAAGLRPTPDRVRETLFNWLAHLRSDWPAIRGLDLFAGTGALGFELASRGARAVTMIEANPAIARALLATRDKLGAPVEIIHGDAFAAAARWPAGTFDVVFADPPFDAGLALPAARLGARLLNGDGLLYLEGPQPLSTEAAALLGLAVVRSGRAGRVHFHLLQPASAGIIAAPANGGHDGDRGISGHV